jgi:hypothetical protein
MIYPDEFGRALSNARIALSRRDRAIRSYRSSVVSISATPEITRASFWLPRDFP